MKFDLPADAQAIRVPSSALMFNDKGMAVAVVGPNGRAEIRPVTIGRDFGATVEIAIRPDAPRTGSSTTRRIRCGRATWCGSRPQPPPEAARMPSAEPFRRVAASACAALAVAGCSLAPTYTRPPTSTPAAYKETGPWTPGQPRRRGPARRLVDRSTATPR